MTAGVLRQRGKLLLAQRYADDSEGNKWEFPGGKVEWGEDPRSGLKRELDEELKVTAAVGQLLEAISVVRDGIHLVLLYFECRIDAGCPEAVECQQIGWWTPAQIDGLPKPPADDEFWAKYRESDLGDAPQVEG